MHGASKQAVVGTGRVRKKPSPLFVSNLVASAPARSDIAGRVGTSNTPARAEVSGRGAGRGEANVALSRGGANNTPARKLVMKTKKATTHKATCSEGEVDEGRGKELQVYTGSSSGVKRGAEKMGKGPDPKWIRVMSTNLATHGTTVTIGGDDRWFGVGPKPTYMFSEAFKILHDAPRYVCKSTRELAHKADVLLGKFISDYVRLREGIEQNLQANLDSLKRKCEETESKVLAFKSKEEEWLVEKGTLTKRVGELESEKVKLKGKLASQKRKLDGRVTKWKKFANARKEELDALKGASAAREGENEKLRAADEQLRAEIESLKAENGNLKANNEKPTTDLKNAVDEATNSFVMGYETCFDKFVDRGYEGACLSIEDYKTELATEGGGRGNDGHGGEDQGAGNAENGDERDGNPRADDPVNSDN